MKTNNRIRSNRSARRAPKQALKNSAPAPDSGQRHDGTVHCFNAWTQSGFINIRASLRKSLKMPRERLLFIASGVTGFDPFRLNENDAVTFAVEKFGEGFIAVQVEVETSRAEDAEKFRHNMNSALVLHDHFGHQIGGYYMPADEWARLERAAVDDNKTIAEFIQSTIREKLARPDAALENRQPANGEGGFRLFLRMERMVNRAVALLGMFAVQRAAKIDSIAKTSRNGAAAIGYQELAADCEDELLEVWHEAHKESCALSRGEPVSYAPGQLPAAVRLQLPVIKAATLLEGLAEELSEAQFDLQ